MKNKIIFMSLLFTLAFVFPVLADEAHHPATDDAATTQVATNNIDDSMMQMKELRQKMSTTADKSERKALMKEHMQKMKDTMSEMGMMGKDGMMGGQSMAMKEHMLEKKMQVMQEMMNGMLAQQEMMMKDD